MYTELTTWALGHLLDMGVHRFNFKKKDGSIRNALGTRNPNLIPKEETVRLIEDISDKSLVFWDLEARSFRSVKHGTEISVL